MSYNPYQQESSGYHSAPGTPLEATFQSWDHQQMEDEARQGHNNTTQGSAATSPTEYQHQLQQHSHHQHHQHQHGQQQQHHVSGVTTAPPTPTGYESHANHLVPSQLRRPPPRESNRSRDVRTSPTLLVELPPSIRPRVITGPTTGSAGASSSSSPVPSGSGSLAVRHSHHGARSRAHGTGHAQLPYRRPQSALGGTQAMVAQAHMTHGTGSGTAGASGGGGGQTRIVRFASGDSTGVMYTGPAGTGDNSGLAALLSAGASPPLGGVIPVTRSSSLPEAGPSSHHAPPPRSAPPLSDTHLNMIPQFSGSTSILSPSIVSPPPPPTAPQEPAPQKYAIRGDVCYDPAIKQLIATLELPGVPRDRLSVSLGQCPYNGVRQIVISGKAVPATPSGPQCFYPVRERRYGEYSRIFAVPSDTTADNIDAQFADGILTLTVSCPSAPDEVEEPASITIR